jgi:hypothetical protein
MPRSGIIIGSPPSTPTRLLRSKKEPDSFTCVKKVHDAPMPPSSKKARRLSEDAARQLDYQAPDDPAERASFNEVQPGTLEFALAWSRQDAKRAKEEHARRLGLCVNLEEEDDEEEDDDVGPSKWRGGDDGQGCSTWAAKDEPPSHDGDGNEDYDVFYHRLGVI